MTITENTVVAIFFIVCIFSLCAEDMVCSIHHSVHDTPHSEWNTSGIFPLAKYLTVTHLSDTIGVITTSPGKRDTMVYDNEKNFIATILPSLTLMVEVIGDENVYDVFNDHGDKIVYSLGTGDFPGACKNIDMAYKDISSYQSNYHHGVISVSTTPHYQDSSRSMTLDDLICDAQRIVSHGRGITTSVCAGRSVNILTDFLHDRKLSYQLSVSEALDRISERCMVHDYKITHGFSMSH